MVFEWWLESLGVYIAALVATAWVTLLERKALGGAQWRKGPNKVSWKGGLQPVADAVKLLTKQTAYPTRSKPFLFLFSPVVSLLLSFCVWHLWPIQTPGHFYSYGVMLFICLSSIHVYALIAAGWGSRCQYRVWGAIRGISLAVRYEIPLVVFFLSFCVLRESWDWKMLRTFAASGIPPMMLAWVCFVGCFSLIILEFNRAPFDLTEAESELVSGFNTEFGATGFVLLFLAEYMRILVGTQLLAIFCVGVMGITPFLFVGMFFCWVVLISRAAYPRVKLDIVIDSCWKRYMPLSLVLLTLCAVVFLFYVYVKI